MVLPNGPEMAALFLGVAAGAAAAPLNAAYREEEFDFYLSDIEAKLLLIEAGLESPARAVAARRGIPIVDVAPDLAAPAGSYRLLRAGEPVAAGKLGTGEFGGPQDVALVLHTSGTTSRPKIVPLSHANLTASARNIGRDPGPRAFRPLPRHHAAVPYPWAGGGAALLHRRGRQPLLPAGLQCAEVLRLAR